MQRNNQNIRAKEHEVAVLDQKKVRNLTKFNMIFSPAIQLQLLNFVNDAVITELLPNIYKYHIFADNKDHYKHAI